MTNPGSWMRAKITLDLGTGEKLVSSVQAAGGGDGGTVLPVLGSLWGCAGPCSNPVTPDTPAMFHPCLVLQADPHSPQEIHLQFREDPIPDAQRRP